jgi:CHAT domain-containing protein
MKLHKLTSLVFVSICIAISLPFGCSLTLAQTTKEMQAIVKKPLPSFEAAKTGAMTGSTIDTNNPETIKLIEEGIKRAEYKLSVYKKYSKDSYPDPQHYQGKRMISDLIQEANERLCDYNIRLADLITRDEQIVKYCGDYFKVFNKEFAAQYKNNPLVEDPTNMMVYYPETDISVIKSLYKVMKKEGIKENRKLIKSLKNGLKTQSNSIKETGYPLRWGIHVLTIGELVAVINDLNLMLASHTNSVDDYKSALNDFNFMKDKYAEYLLDTFRYDSDSSLAKEGAMLAGIGRLHEAESKFDQSFENLPFESLSRLKDYENVLIKQKKYEKALEISDLGRSLNLLRNWGDSALSEEQRQEQLKKEPRMTIDDFKKIAKVKNITIVEYSLHEDDQLLIWVVTPDSNVYFRQVNLSNKTAKIAFNQDNLSSVLSIERNFLNLFIFNFIVTILVLLIFAKSQNKKLAILFLGVILVLNTVGCQNQKQSQFAQSQIDNIPSLKDLIQVNYGLINQENRRTDIPQIITSLSNKYCQKSIECLQKLNQILIEPIADILPINPDDHVVFIPDSQLLKVPFAALRDTQGKYLIEKHTIYYAPSIKILKMLHNEAYVKVSISAITEKYRKYSQKAPLIVGNPIMPTIKLPAIDESSQEYSEIRNIKPQKLGQLKGTENEAREIAKIYQTEPLIGKDATGEVVLKKMQNADIIHLATHGFYTSMGNSVLALTPSRPSCVGDAPMDCNFYNLEDGVLDSSSIFNPKTTFKAQLIVLSACETGLAGLGDYRSSSFINEFMKKGVPSIVVSLWKIPDSPSDELMINFHKNLQNDPDKAKALRQAMLNTMKKHENPGLWSAFVLFGEAEKPTNALD